MNEKTDQITLWLMTIEKSNYPQSLPPDLYEAMKADLHDSFWGDFNLLIEEFDFY